MLLRMLGKAEEAQNSSYQNPFTDVPAWASKYIAYAYAKGYTSGTSKTTFGTNNIVTPEQFLTFMLRALGYNDKAGDFNVSTAIQKAESLKLTTVGKYNVGSKSFYRGDCVDIIYNVLGATKKPDNITITKYLIDNKSIDATKAAKYGFYTPAPTYEMIRIPLKNGMYYAADIYAKIPGAKYISLCWGSNAVNPNNYKTAFDVDSYNKIKSSSLTANELDYYQNHNNNAELSSDIRGYTATCVFDDKLNMVAAAIFEQSSAIKNGYIDIALVSVNGADLIATQNADFEKVFGNPAEYKNAIIRIEKAQVNFAFISKKTGKVVSTGLASTNGVPDTYYRYVIDSTKYSELAANTKYLGEYSLSSGMTAVDSLKQFSLNWFKSGNYDGTLSGKMLVTDFTMGDNGWTKKASEWNNTRCVSFADANKKLIGCTSFVPSQLKIVDVGTVEQTAYVN